MNRLLLALLALISGLTIQAAPVHARMSDTEASAVDCARTGTKGAASQAAEGAPSKIERRDREIQRARPAVRSKVFIPSVQFGADRALE
jgi:hypothetical protein